MSEALDPGPSQLTLPLPPGSVRLGSQTEPIVWLLEVGATWDLSPTGLHLLHPGRTCSPTVARPSCPSLTPPSLLCAPTLTVLRQRCTRVRALRLQQRPCRAEVPRVVGSGPSSRLSAVTTCVSTACFLAPRDWPECHAASRAAAHPPQPPGKYLREFSIKVMDNFFRGSTRALSGWSLMDGCAPP